MKASTLLRWLVAIIVIIIIIGGVIIIIVPIPIPEPPCLVCGFKGLRFLGIAEIILGAISLGLISRIRKNEIFK